MIIKMYMRIGSFVLFNLIEIFFFIRYFIFDRTLGYGLGDIIYILLFIVYFFLNWVLFLLKKRILFYTSIIFSIHILLMIYILYGAEVKYNWSHGIWLW